MMQSLMTRPPAQAQFADPRAAAEWAEQADRAALARAALFASRLQRSDAPTSAMAAEAITATVRRLGIDGCLSRMAQEFGDHPDAAAERMHWIIPLTAGLAA